MVKGATSRFVHLEKKNSLDIFKFDICNPSWSYPFLTAVSPFYLIYTYDRKV